MSLTYSQIKSVAAYKGFSGNDLNIAVAVAMAESGGNPNDHNTTPPDDSYGLWQINMLGDLGPPRRAALHLKTNDQLFVPAINAQAAAYIHGQSGWGAWTTYTSGKYKDFMSQAVAAPVVPVSDPSVADILKIVPGDLQGIAKLGGGVTDAVANPLAAIPAAFNSLGDNLFKSVSNIGGILVAIALLLGGVTILVVNSKSGKTAIAGGKKAAKLAAVVA